MIILRPWNQLMSYEILSSLLIDTTRDFVLAQDQAKTRGTNDTSVYKSK